MSMTRTTNEINVIVAYKCIDCETIEVITQTLTSLLIKGKGRPKGRCRHCCSDWGFYLSPKDSYAELTK